MKVATLLLLICEMGRNKRNNPAIEDFFNISSKILAKDTVFLKYLVTFVAQKRMVSFEGLKKRKCGVYCVKKNSSRRTIV